MKKIFALMLIFALMPVPAANAAYTLDSIYGDYDDADYEPKKPYLLHSFGFTPLDPVEIILDKKQIYFHLNENEGGVALNGRTMPLNASKPEITYSSSDETVAAVDENGIVTSKNKLGSAIITAKAGDLTSECRVDVIVGVDTVSISPPSLTLYADRPAAAQLTAVISPSDAGVTAVAWQSADASVAAVDKTGVVTPSGVGETTITATSKDKGISASISVTVKLFEEDADVDAESEVKYTHYKYTLDEAVDLQLQAAPTVFTTDAYEADEIDVENYITPSFLINDDEKYQFIDLSKSNGVSAETLNRYLSGKGVLDGKGEVFADAARQNGISEVYLVVHSCLETGNGTSALAQGVEYGGETVYNMFGIGAADAAPVAGGAEYAYNKGWTSVDDAIYGGAEWISENYINNSKYSQNTLYKMRWNPAAPGVHQYATDVEWASKQSKSLKNMFAAFPSAVLSFDYPVYAGETEEDLGI